jgi:hypothetical protein
MKRPRSEMEARRDTPPCSEPKTPPQSDGQVYDYATPTSIVSASPSTTSTSRRTPTIPANLTQAIVDSDPELKRFQQDLLILTSFNETSTLHWRPSWFDQDPHSKSFWTLYNPPNVVTELLPRAERGRMVYTRRLRRKEDGDGAPRYMKSWEQWNRYCDLRGVPRDFLCGAQIELMRLGSSRDGEGAVCGE